MIYNSSKLLNWMLQFKISKAKKELQRVTEESAIAATFVSLIHAKFIKAELTEIVLYEKMMLPRIRLK